MSQWILELDKRTTVTSKNEIVFEGRDEIILISDEISVNNDNICWNDWSVGCQITKISSM